VAIKVSFTLGNSYLLGSIVIYVYIPTLRICEATLRYLASVDSAFFNVAGADHAVVYAAVEFVAKLVIDVGEGDPLEDGRE
jgi:hypothetical protein